MNKGAIIYVLLACVIALFVSGFFVLDSIWNRGISEIGNIEFRSGRTIPPNPDLAATVSNNLLLEAAQPNELDDYGTFSLGIPVSDNSGVISLGSPQDPFVIQVRSTLSSPYTFLLKVFYNYKEVNFRVQGAEEYDSKFTFQLDANAAVNIPLQLSPSIESRNTNSRLTVALVKSPEHFIVSDGRVREILWNTPGLALDFMIDYGYERSIVMDDASFEFSYESEFFGFSIHTDPEPPGDGFLRSFGDHTLEVSSGEKVNLTFFANAHTVGILDIDSYVIVSMLGWQQIDMNEEPFLLIDVPHPRIESGQHGHFSIFVPEEPGFYEFFALMAPNPMRANTYYNFLPLELHRFTLEVVN